MTARYYVSSEREREYGYFRVIDRTREDTPRYSGQSDYWCEHVMAMSEDEKDAQLVCKALNLIERIRG